MPMTTTTPAVRLPAYLPVTTYGSKHPLDRLIRPFLGRFAPMLMVSYHYARQIDEPLALPVFVDSGGFAAMLPDSEVIEDAQGLGHIRRTGEDSEEDVSPQAVLALQLQHAAWGATLDFPVSPALASDELERERRMRLTLANAAWALRQPRPADFTLFGCVQGWDLPSYVACAQRLLTMGFDHLALGGFVPRLAQREMLRQIVAEVRLLLPAHGMLHVFGVGAPEFAREVFGAGATSVDSSAYVRAAASGKRWDGQPWDTAHPSALERAHAALANLRYGAQASGAAMP